MLVSNLIFSLGFFLTIVSHPYFVSIFEVVHSESSSSVQITMKVFLDDLERGIEMDGFDQALKLNSQKEYAHADSLIFAYVKRHFSIYIDGTPYSLLWVGKEYETDLLWAYLEIPNISTAKELRVITDFLTQYQETQTNIVHVTLGDIKKSALLHKDEQEFTVKRVP